MSLFSRSDVASIDRSARYQADTSTDGGRTWEASDFDTQCGEMVQILMVGAIEDGRAPQVSGPVVTIDGGDGKTTRFTPTR